MSKIEDLNTDIKLEMPKDADTILADELGGITTGTIKFKDKLKDHHNETYCIDLKNIKVEIELINNKLCIALSNKVEDDVSVLKNTIREHTSINSADIKASISNLEVEE